ncbi:hypothetical protein MKW94_022209, partial [Papaver nudicaule]|nr:hypothetical protein [Papaver nudicaule]
YSVDAILDVALTNLLIAGKLFVGQKLRASKTVNLRLHINGTYRAHWASVRNSDLPRLLGVSRVMVVWCPGHSSEKHVFILYFIRRA